MASLNHCQFIGHVGKDPEIRSFQNGNRVASFSLACSNSWKDKQTGERKEQTEWINISVFDERLVSLAENYITKGKKIYVQGAMETRKWQDKEGKDHYTTCVSLRPFNGQIILLDSKENSGASQQSEYSSKKNTKKDAGFGGGFGSSTSSEEELDDSIPF